MKYLLLGMGVSNQSIERYFRENNYDYEIYDDKLFKHDINMEQIDVVVKSPGVNPDHFLLKKAKKVITDLELFYLINPDKTFITVTGSNGKTTTVNLLKHLIDDIDLGGNVGIPLFDFSESKNPIIIEASSFMLEYVEHFHSNYCVLLNLYKTHLEHHKTFTNYVKSKMKLLKNTLPDDYIIYNYDDLLIRRLVENYQGIKVPFSQNQKIGIHIENNNIVYHDKIIENINNIPLIGKHNLENVLATLGVVLNFRGDVKNLKTFYGLKFRLEYVFTVFDVDIYNDSKSTNFNALSHALQSFPDKRIFLICGGQKRYDDFKIFDQIHNIVRCYTYGENREEMYAYFTKKVDDCQKFNTLEEVVMNLNFLNCDILLFSPGCVSYDQFSSYEERGDCFNIYLGKYLQNLTKKANSKRSQ